MYEALITKDGSLTYRNTDLGVTYRSIHGAESESRYVFLEGSGITERENHWRVLELGFGTGLNFALTCQAAEQAEVSLEFVSLEPKPMPNELWVVEERWKNLKFDEAFVHNNINLTLIKETWQNFTPHTNYFHACYHDPFGPGQSPECWETACFEWSHKALQQDGILSTFGASTSARQAMKDAGFLVGTLLGPHMKREMTVASPTEAPICNARAWKRKK